MKRTITTAIIALTLVCIARERAAAYPHYYKSVEARPIFRTHIWSWNTGWKNFETKNLGPTSAGLCLTPDTFMVVTRPDGRSYANDNCAPTTTRRSSFRAFGRFYSVPLYGANKDSCRRVYSATPGFWTVTVFAAKPYTCGTADLFVDGAKRTSGFEFGGTRIALGTQAGRRYTMQTVHTPAGATDTNLLLYNGNWQEKAFDDDHGYGPAAKITYQIDRGDQLIVGSASLNTAGYTSVVINECLSSPEASKPNRERCWKSGLDRDRDNLSDDLEAELGTNPDFHDTDRDGLFDYFEVIGRAVPGAAELELPRIGANPLRRDLFVEFDRYLDTPPFTEAEVATMQEVFYDLPSLSPNPDGSTGIALHADTGLPCHDGTLCGDWGGSEELNMDATYPRNKVAVAQNFGPTRQGIFHYGYLGPWGGGQGGVGRSTFWAQRSSCIPVHELGHNLGLRHWGGQMPRETQMNYRSAYPSTMNYAFQCRMPGTTVGRSRFSEGLMDKIDNTSFDESSYSPGQSKAYLAGPPYNYWVNGDQVDFNRDFRINEPLTGNPVAFDPAPPARPYLRPGWPDFQQLQSIGDRAATGGGALAVTAVWPSAGVSRTWAFVPFAHSDGAVYPDYARHLDVPGAESRAWSSWSRGTYLNGHPDGEATAVSFESDQGIRILLLFPDRSGALQYRIIDPSAPSIGGWRPVPNWPRDSRALQASAAVIDDHVEIVWADSRIRDVADNVYLAKLNADQSWKAPILLPGIAALFTPGIAQTPDGASYMALIAEDDRQLKFYRRVTTGPTWSLASDMGTMRAYAGEGYDGGVPVGVRRRMQLLFLPYANNQKAAFADGSGYLAAFWNAGNSGGNQDNWINVRAYTQGYVSAESRTMRRPAGLIFQKFTARPNPGQSIAVARRGIHVAMLYNPLQWNSGASQPPAYVPFANGIAPQSSGLNIDHDDAGIIDQTLCRSAWEFVKGGQAACYCQYMDRTDVQCAPTPAGEWVICEAQQ